MKKFLKKFLSNKNNTVEDIKNLCEKLNIIKYTIIDGKVNVEGDVDLSSLELTKIPLVFGIVTGNFDISNNKLESLIGSPNTVGGNFNCSKNNLTRLLGSPGEIYNCFDCSENNLKSLRGGPSKVDGDYKSIYNFIQSLDDLNCTIRGNKYFGSNLNQSIQTT